jgi:signal transduction histidine kinase
LHDNVESISNNWLVKLDIILNEKIQNIFPTEMLLDHIPTLIHGIANVIAEPHNNVAISSSVIVEKARELGKLRHKQQATVYQILREYDMLTDVLEEFLVEESEKYEAEISYQDCIKMMADIAHIIHIILEATMNTFIGKYMQKINNQTERLVAFNSFVGHELKKTLQVALLNSELLMEKPTTLKEDNNDLQTIQKNVRQAMMMLNELEGLTLSSGPAQDIKASPIFQKIDISTLLDDIKLQLTDMLAEHEVNINPGLTLKQNFGSVISEQSKLNLILVNVLTNAIKYSDPGKTKKTIEINRINDEPSNMHVLEIADNGLEIPESMLEEVFKLRVRAHRDNKIAKDIDGSGSGLFLVREAVDSLGGKIDLDSKVGVGTTLRISIPDNLH